jgi:hypothetical protein
VKIKALPENMAFLRARIKFSFTGGEVELRDNAAFVRTKIYFPSGEGRQI